jgi:hypothetical protein
MFDAITEFKLTRHSGAGRNPVEKMSPAKAGQQCGFVRFAGWLLLLDSGLRRNDAGGGHHA